jgi:FkbM family methyltransferase
VVFITEAYRAEQAALHARGNYGTAALQYGQVVAELLASTGARSLLDYGCGSKRSLLQVLELADDVVYEGYDPAIPEYAHTPLPAELVTCIDVLEHIEPDLLDNVLDHLSELCDPYGFFTVHIGPAQKVLSDGRNAHLTQKGQDWWMPRFERRFKVLSVQGIPSGFVLVVRSLASDTQLPLPGALRLGQAATAVQSNAASPAGNYEAAKAGSPGSQHMVLKHAGHRILFTTPNEMTAWRVKSLFDKEPDTIRWIEGMARGSVLVDIGANVGMYSIFSAMTRDVRVFAFEPESQNYALLNANIAANELSGRVYAFPLALSDEMKLDKLYLSQFEAGGSCHSFAEKVGFDLKPRQAAFTQGAFSVTLDQLIDAGAIPVPDYIKLDVDGIEHKVLAGAHKTLANPTVKELLVELNTHLPEHNAVIERLRGLGFGYDEEQVRGALRKKGAFEGVGEFVFRRQPADTQVDFARTYRIAPPRLARGRAVMQHVLQQVERTPVTENPFPYLVVDEVFPADYYAEMLANFPSRESLRPIAETGRVAEDLYKERLVVLFTDDEFKRMTGAQQRFWRDFAEWMYTDQFLNFFIYKFQRHLEPRVERIVAKEGALNVKGDALLVNDCTDYAIGPHTDSPHRLVTFLFYLPRDASMRELGTSVYRPKDPSFVCWGGPHHEYAGFDNVATVEFMPNRLLAFPKTERSFHGVEPIKRENVNRPLLINNIRLLNKTTH